MGSRLREVAPPAARGSQEAGFTQPRAHLLPDPCPRMKPASFVVGGYRLEVDENNAQPERERERVGKNRSFSLALSSCWTHIAKSVLRLRKSRAAAAKVLALVPPSAASSEGRKKDVLSV